MKHTLRNTVLAVGLASLLTGGLAACGSDADEGDSDTVRFGYWSGGTGYLGMMPEIFEKNPELATEHGVEIEAVAYESLQELYTDAAQNRIDIALASPDAPGAQAIQGAPVGIIGVVAASTTGLVGKGGELSAERLDGARVAMANAGIANIVRAQVEEKYGLSADEDYEVLPAQDNAQAISQVAAGTADFAMAWEPHSTRAIETFGLELVASPEQLAFADHTTWQFVIFANDKLADDRIEPVMDAVADAGAWMEAHPDEVDEMAVGFGQEPGTIARMIGAGRSPVDARPLTEELQADIEKDFEVLVDSGVLEEMPPASVFRK